MQSILASYIEHHVQESHDGIESVQIQVEYTEDKPVITHCPLCGEDCSEENRKI